MIGHDGLLFGSGWPRKLTMHFPQNSRRRSGRRLTAKAGLTHYVGVGEFQAESFYDAGAMCRTWGCSFRRVRWEPSPGIRPSPVRFAQTTLYSLQPEKFRQFGF